MLQDAWSGIEKELGYDDNIVPDEAKRDFYRVGALLEMADIEFLRVRTEHTKKRAAHTEPVNTFAEHLQSVAKEPQPAAVVTSPQPAPVVQPVAEIPVQLVYTAPAPIAPAPQPEVHIPQPVAVVPQPVVEIPEPVVAVPQAAPVVEMPVAVEPPVVVVAEVTAPVFEIPVAPVPQPVAEVPQAAPAFEIPAVAQPIIAKIEPILAAAPIAIVGEQVQEKIKDIVEEHSYTTPIAEAATNDFAANGVDSLKALADSINNVQKEAPVAAPVEIPVIPQVVAEIPKAVQKEVVAPIAASIPLPVNGNFNVNGNGAMEQVAEHIPDADKAAFYETVPNKATKSIQLDENAPMTDITLREYVLNSKLLKEVDQHIAERAGAKINFEIDIEGDVERLRFLKVYTLKQLHERLADNKDDIVAFAEKWIGKDNGGSFDSGISLFYLEYLLVGKKNDPAFAVEYVVKFISDNDYSARYIIPTYNSIRNTEAPNFSHLTLRA